jgi:hypothetical protein
VVEVDAVPDGAVGPPLELHAQMLINNTVAAATRGRITARFYRIRSRHGEWDDAVGELLAKSLAG